MPFDTLSKQLQEVATRALAACRQKYGNNGIKIEEGIDNSIYWRPSFQIRPTKTRMVTVEVADNLYPESLRGAAHEVGHFDFPILVYQACTLDAYVADPKQSRIKLLREHGFGIITVDDDGAVSFQQNCIPLAQHIAPLLLEKEMAELNTPLRVLFRAAYETFIASEKQGLQEAGQIVEGFVHGLVKAAIKDGVVPAATAAKALADQIDDLWATATFKPHRAALGGAREFVRNFRNNASHPANSAKQASERIRRCRTGFLDAIRHTSQLKQVAAALGYRVGVVL